MENFKQETSVEMQSKRFNWSIETQQSDGQSKDTEESWEVESCAIPQTSCGG